MMRWRELILICAVWGLAACASAQTNYPTALDTTTNLPVKNPGNTVTSAETNLQNSAIRAVENAIGTDATLTTNSVLSRLAGKLDTSSLATFNSKIINYTLNAQQYAGADIGAKVNAAVADCDAQVTSAGYCRITLPPGIHTQSTAIKITRSSTELDCQGAYLLQSAGFNDVPIRLNYATTGVFSGSWLNDVTVRNCRVLNGSQTSMTTQLGGSPPGSLVDIRTARVVAWRIRNLRLQHIDVYAPYGPGIAVYESQGSVSDVYINNTRAPYSGADAAGVFATAEGYGAGVAGRPIALDHVRVNTAVTYGVQAVVGVEMHDIDVRVANSACIMFGASAPEGWLTLDGFTLTDCSQTSSVATGAIDDSASSDVLYHVVVRNGTIRRARSDGVRLHAASGATISGVNVECFGSGLEGRGISVIGGTTASITGNTINPIGTSGCASMAGVPYAIEVIAPMTNTRIQSNFADLPNTTGYGGLLVAAGGSSTITSLLVADNIFTNMAVPIGVTLTNSGGTNANINISRNSLGCAVANCGVVTLALSASVSLEDTTITDNRLTNGVYGLVTNAASPLGTVGPIVLDGNRFWPRALGGAVQSESEVFQGGAATLPIAYGSRYNYPDNTNASTRVVLRTNTNGSTVTAKRVVCVKTDGSFEQCGTGTTARLALGVAAHNVLNTVVGSIVVAGYVSGVPCTGTIAAGDLVVRSTSTAGSVMANNSPGAGETLGKALGTCSGSLVNVVLGTL